jgi:hypothetical protein
MSKVKGMLVCWDKKLTGKHLLTTNYSIVGIPPYQSLIRLHLLFTTRSSCCRIFLVAPRSNFVPSCQKGFQELKEIELQLGWTTQRLDNLEAHLKILVSSLNF